MIKANDLIKKIDDLVKSGNYVIFSDIHGVGDQFRIGNINFASVVGNQKKAIIDGKPIDLDDFDKVFNHLKSVWAETGRTTQERGLY